ncbi:hypothetical protein MTO96_014502 [Rhipicephalus appendiculatus]
MRLVAGEKKQRKRVFGFLRGLSLRTLGVFVISDRLFCHHRPWDSGGRIVTSACPAVVDSGDKRSVPSITPPRLASLPAGAAFLQRTDSRQPWPTERRRCMTSP